MSLDIQDLRDIHLTITEEVHGVNLTVTDSEDLGFSVQEKTTDIHLLVSEEGVNIEIKQGDDGLSAYEIWKKNGNIGTELDFLESLKGEKGDTGDSGSDSDKHYVHDQFTPSNIWIIHHPLNKKPSITVTDTAGNVYEGDEKYNNNNQVTITFNFPFSGYAYLN